MLAYLLCLLSFEAQAMSARIPIAFARIVLRPDDRMPAIDVPEDLAGILDPPMGPKAVPHYDRRS